MTRRLTLVGVFVVLEQGSMMQLMIGTAFSTCYLLLQVQVGPYTDTSADFLANGCSFALLVFFLCCIAFKVGTLTELSAVQDVLSKELASDFRTSNLALSVTLFASAAFALVASFAILVVQIRMEAHRRRFEMRAARARRLRYLDGDEEVILPQRPALETLLQHVYPSKDGLPADAPGAGPFHLFLSHNWAHGQAAMRIVKTRLREMLPDVEIFLDVDNLGGGSDHPHIDVSSFMLCYLTQRWFSSEPCLREFIRAILRKTPMIALLEPFQGDTYGGHTEAQGRQIIASREWWERWRRFDARGEVDKWAKEWGQPGLRLPTAQEATDALFASEPITFSRLADFQDVTMRLIGERLSKDFAHAYGAEYVQTTYKQDELATRCKATQMKIELRPGRRFHLFCSEHNPGTVGVGRELQQTCPAVTHTTTFGQLAECEHFVVLLTAQTWTRGEASDAFAREVTEAMRTGVHCLLVHEVPGARCGDDEARRAAPFEHFFDSTPKHLLRAGLYNEIAMNLAGLMWRDAGLLKAVQEIAKGGGERKPVDVALLGTTGASASARQQSGAGVLPSARRVSSLLYSFMSAAPSQQVQATQSSRVESEIVSSRSRRAEATVLAYVDEDEPA